MDWRHWIFINVLCVNQAKLTKPKRLFRSLSKLLFPFITRLILTNSSIIINQSSLGIFLMYNTSVKTLFWKTLSIFSVFFILYKKSHHLNSFLVAVQLSKSESQSWSLWYALHRQNTPTNQPNNNRKPTPRKKKRTIQLK